MISAFEAALALLFAAPLASTGAPISPPVAQAGAADVMRETDTYEFRYAYPAEAAAVPALAARFAAEAKALEAETADTARSSKKSSDEGSFPFHRHSLEKEWSVTADTPALLALSATIYSFTGGAHPNSGFATLIWDRRAGAEVPLAGLFGDPAAALSAITAPYCTALAAERTRRRDGQRLPSFEDCPPLDATMPVALVARGGKVAAFRMLLGPYVAGPYAEGAYEIEVAVTDAVRGLVKPEYRASF